MTTSQPVRLQNDKTPTVGVLIRFASSQDTLPPVLEALKQQSLKPGVILGVGSQSCDGSGALIEAAGGQVIGWPGAYEHSKVLNYGLRHLATDLVLILSSHTILESPDTLARMVSAMQDPRTACVSGKWDGDGYYTDRIDWQELRAKGLKLGSIYSNSMGMIRRSFWMEEPFDEGAKTAEDYAWAVSQVKRGYVCQRMDFPFSYRRSGVSRDLQFTEVAFKLARQHRLPVVWLGVLRSLLELFRGILADSEFVPLHLARLKGWILSRRAFCG